MTNRDKTEHSSEQLKNPRVSRLVSFSILLCSAVLLHGIVFTSLDVLVPIDDGASSKIALVIDSGMKPMDMLVDAR